jgi:transposase
LWPIKSAERQAEVMLLGVRDLLIKQRTAMINAIRGHAAEFGVIAAKGPVKVAELLQRAHAEEASVPALALDMLRLLAAQLDALDVKLKLIEARLTASHRENPLSQCLASQPGIGPIGAVSFALRVTEPKSFRSGRHFAAWLGLTPKDNSSGGRRRQGRISPAGQRSSAQAGRSRCDGGDPLRQAGPRVALVAQPASAQAEEACGNRAGQQDGSDALGHDGER